MIVDHFGDLADNSARGHNRVAAAHGADHGLMFFLPLLLGTDDQEIHHTEHQRDHDKEHGIEPATRRRGGLGVSRGNQHEKAPLANWPDYSHGDPECNGCECEKGLPSPQRRDMSGLMSKIKDQNALLTRIAEALEAIAPAPRDTKPFKPKDLAYVFVPPAVLKPVPHVAHIGLAMLTGIDHVRDILLANTEQFAAGHGANNALLWGARGMGKSSLVKAAHAEVASRCDPKLVLIEIHREDIAHLPSLMDRLRGAKARFILFCDDLSFDTDDTSYKSLKAVLEGGIEGRPDNVVLYATSNRRHLMPRDMMENERSTAINPSEAVEEKVSLSDRFGLWLGFHACSQADYLTMIDRYCDAYGLDAPRADIHHQALEWATTRGARSGRVAWQFVQDLAGRLGKAVSP